MRKKILFILICLVSIFGFVNEGYGYVDSGLKSGVDEHELLYDIEKLYFTSDNKMILEGWAFIHNYHNLGGDLLGEGKSWDDMSSSSRSKNIKLEMFFRSGKDESTTIVEGITYEQSHDINGKLVDLTDWMCERNPDGTKCNEGSIYYDLGFKVTIDIDKVNSLADSNKDYTLYLKLTVDDNGEHPVEVAISIVKSSMYKGDKDFYSETNKPNNITITGFSNEVLVVAVNAHQLSSTGNFIACGGPGRDVYFSAGKNEPFDSLNEKGTCSTGTQYEYPIRLYKIGKYYAAAGWVTGKGSITLKFTGEDVAVCKEQILNSQIPINNCDGSVNYLCGGMTVKTGSISANISISENASLESKDTSLTKVMAGMGFEYNMTYTDTVKWKILDRSYSNDIAMNDKAIEDKVLSTYYKYNKTNLQNTLNNAIKDVLDVKSSYGDANFSDAGSWSCGNMERKTSGDTFIYTVTCTYAINKANIDRRTGKIASYNNGATGYLDGGNRYYIPMRYPSNSKFNWDVFSGDSTLSLLEVSYNKDDLNKLNSPKIIINTTTNKSNSCYINVENEFYDIDSPGCSGEGCVPSTVKGYKFIYRSISVDNPFPNYAVLPDNWKLYSDTHGGLSRLYGSYSYDPVYVTQADVKNTLGDDFNYSDKSDIDNSGSVTDVINSTYFSKYPTTKNDYHCRLGEFNDGVCDTQ